MKLVLGNQNGSNSKNEQILSKLILCIFIVDVIVKITNLMWTNEDWPELNDMQHVRRWFPWFWTGSLSFVNWHSDKGSHLCYGPLICTRDFWLQRVSPNYNRHVLQWHLPTLITSVGHPGNLSEQQLLTSTTSALAPKEFPFSSLSLVSSL